MSVAFSNCQHKIKSKHKITCTSQSPSNIKKKRHYCYRWVNNKNNVKLLQTDDANVFIYLTIRAFILLSKQLLKATSCLCIVKYVLTLYFSLSLYVFE